MSEIRKAIALMKRVDVIEDAPARRMAIELGALACDRGQVAARRAEHIGPGPPDYYEDVCGGGGGGDGGGCRHGGVASADADSRNMRGENGPRAGADEAKQLLFAGPGQGAGESVAPCISLSLSLALALCGCLSVSLSLSLSLSHTIVG